MSGNWWTNGWCLGCQKTVTGGNCSAHVCWDAGSSDFMLYQCGVVRRLRNEETSFMPICIGEKASLPAAGRVAEMCPLAILVVFSRDWRWQPGLHADKRSCNASSFYLSHKLSLLKQTLPILFLTCEWKTPPSLTLPLWLQSETGKVFLAERDEVLTALWSHVCVVVIGMQDSLLGWPPCHVMVITWR